MTTAEIRERPRTRRFTRELNEESLGNEESNVDLAWSTKQPRTEKKALHTYVRRTKDNGVIKETLVSNYNSQEQLKSTEEQQPDTPQLSQPPSAADVPSVAAEAAEVEEETEADDTQSFARKRKRPQKDFLRNHFGFPEPKQYIRTPADAIEVDTDETNLQDEEMILLSDDDSSHLQAGCELIATQVDEHRTSAASSGIKTAYPSCDDPDAVEIDSKDLDCLDDTVYLNDTVIDFYIKHLQVSKTSDRQQHLHIFNSFFFKKLAKAVCAEKFQDGKEEIGKLRKWIKRISIFEKTYLIMPIHDRMHWSLAIVSFSGTNSESYEPCCILHLDSMRNGHNSRVVYEVLRRYLYLEWGEHSGDDAAWRSAAKKKNVRVKKVKVPQQDNEYDCGLFLLHFIEKFVEKAPTQFNLDMVKDMFEWFTPADAASRRSVTKLIMERVLSSASS